MSDALFMPVVGQVIPMFGTSGRIMLGGRPGYNFGSYVFLFFTIGGVGGLMLFVLTFVLWSGERKAHVMLMKQLI